MFAQIESCFGRKANMCVHFYVPAWAAGQEQGSHPSGDGEEREGSGRRYSNSNTNPFTIFF